MHVKCRNCPDVIYRSCSSHNIITNGRLCCEKEPEPKEAKSVCDHCGEPLKLGHFAYETNWKEFWCENCLRELYAELKEQEGNDGK